MRKLLFALCLLCLWCAPLHAETLTDMRDLAQHPRLDAYLKSPAMYKDLYKLGKEQDKQLGLAQNCTGNTRLTLKGLYLLAPIEWPEKSANPTQGAWQYRYDVTRCGETKTYNAIAVAGKKGKAPVIKSSFPGNTQATVVLQRDAMVPAMAAAGMAAQPDKACKKINVLDMRVTKEPDASGSQPWQEVWTYSFCGRIGEADITFTPEPGGKGTRIDAKPVKPEPLESKP